MDQAIKDIPLPEGFQLLLNSVHKHKALLDGNFYAHITKMLFPFESKGPNTALFGVAHPCGHKFNQKCCNSFSSNNLLTLQGKKQVSNIYKLYHFFN